MHDKNEKINLDTKIGYLFVFEFKSWVCYSTCTWPLPVEEEKEHRVHSLRPVIDTITSNSSSLQGKGESGIMVGYEPIILGCSCHTDP